MNKKALDDYDTLEWDAAKKTLLDALVAGKKAGLDNHPVMARTYVHLGAVYITGFKNRDKAIQSFTRALEIDPAIQLSKGIATQRSQRRVQRGQARRGAAAGRRRSRRRPRPKKRASGPVMETATASRPAAQEGAGEASTSDDDRTETDLPVKIQALDCPNADEAILEKAGDAALRGGAERCPVAKVFLTVQASPARRSTPSSQMTKSPKGWYVGKIPKKAVTGKSVPFYFEGRNAAGKAVVVNGEKGSPNIMLLMEEEPTASTRPRRRRATAAGRTARTSRTRSKSDGRPVQGDARLGASDKALEGLDVRFGKRKWWIGIGAGSGFGYAKGDGLEAVNTSPDQEFHNLASIFVAGGAWAGLGHLVPEIGVQLTPNLGDRRWKGRFQYIPQPAKYARFTAQGALSRAGEVDASTRSRARSASSARRSSGGGEGFRFVVKPAAIRRRPGQSENSAVKDFQDTVRGGPLVGGGWASASTTRRRRRSRSCSRPRAGRVPDLLVRRRRQPGAAVQLLRRRWRRRQVDRRVVTSPRRRTRSRSRPPGRARASIARAAVGGQRGAAARAAHQVGVAAQRPAGRGLPEDRARPRRGRRAASWARPGTARARSRAAFRRRRP